ncbi:MAG: hypothetical protein NTV49_01750 [Kiritimatiellaeota bacterium]|nr:hypothetical protein [Kiritimatiellota bacterium]
MKTQEPLVDGKWFGRKGERPRRSGLVRFVGTSLAIVLILYVGVWLLGFTAGFRSYLEDDLQSRLDLPVKIRKARLTPALNIVVEGLATAGSGRKGQPGVAIQKCFLEWSVVDGGRWHLPRLRHIQVEGGTLAFAPAEQGGWAPAGLAPFSALIAEWGGFKLPAPAAPVKPAGADQTMEKAAAAQPVNVLEKLRQCSLSISDGRITWWSEAGRELASAETIRLAVTPLALPNRLMTHILLTLDEASLADGRRVQNFRFECLDLRSQRLILELKADWSPAGASPAGPPEEARKPPESDPGA